MRSACLAVMLTFCCGSAANAATVRVEDRYPDADGAHRQVIVEDIRSETNAVSITYLYEPTSDFIPPNGDADVSVRDEASPLEAGPGCEQQADGSVRCQVAEVIAIEAHLGGGADRGTATPSGDVSCDCVRLMGGSGDDLLTSRDGADLAGGDGDDVLRAEPSPAARVGHSLSDVDDDSMFGETGDDVIESGDGRDQLAGGAGDDILRGGDGDDRLTGYGGNPDEPVVDAGTDQLDGGRGNDTVDDGDDDGFNHVAAPDISRDILIGGPGQDTVGSYLDRSDRVIVDLSEAGNDGAPEENDALVNVETVKTGGGDDRLFGDGDRNFLASGQGENYVRGRGGDDFLHVEAPARHRVHGDRGDDLIATRPWARGPFYCGTGRDRVVQEGYGADAPRLPDRRRNLGPVVAGNCEAIATGFRGLALHPKPKLDGRTLRFRVMGARRHNPRYMIVTAATKPFKHVDRAKIYKRKTVEFRLPRWLARRAHRKRGALLRAEFSSRGYRGGVDMVWRFRVQA